jgi:hypothetical protein
MNIKFPLLFTFHLALAVSYGQEKQTMVLRKASQPDTSLTNHYEQWRVTTPGKRKVAFGSFKVVQYESGKALKLNKERNGNVFRYDRVLTKVKTANLIVLHNGKDSVFISTRMRLSDENEGSNITLFGGGQNKESHSAKISEMSITPGSDTVTWYFIPSLLTSGNDTAIIYHFGEIIGGYDTISIVYASNFEGLKKVWRGYPAGLFFIKDSRQIGALLYGSDYYVWLSTLCEEKILTISGSFITAYISAVQH